MSVFLMDKENFFNNTNGFSCLLTTDSESDDDYLARLTRRFARSASLQEPTYSLKEKRVFSGSPESTVGWSVSSRPQAPSPPPFVKGDEDAWNLIYTAAGQVARMKMETKMSMSNGSAGVVADKNERGLIAAPLALDHPHCSPWGRSEEEVFLRQQRFVQNKGLSGRESCGSGGGGCGVRPLSFPNSSWPPPQLQNHRLQQHRPNQHRPCNAPVLIKPVILGGSGDGGAAVAKRECAGTGVFLPRRYCNNPPESRKRQACSPAHPPARVVQSSSKTFDPITAQAQAPTQANINGCFVPRYEMLMGRRNAMILAAQQRRSNNIHGGVMEAPVNNPEVLLPQEWTY